VSQRAASSMIDAAASQEDTKLLTKVFQLLQRNPSRLITQYGTRVPQIQYLPTSTTQIQTRLKDAPFVPSDDRVKEVTSVLALLTLASTCLILDGPVPNLLLFSLTCIVILDNFSDVLKLALSKQDFFKLPELQLQLPVHIPLGTGELTKDAIAGWTRLFTQDSERNSQTEAAAFYLGYVLGLPCFAFQPVAKEALTMELECSDSDSLEELQRMLMWLYAPVSYEYSLHAQMMSSDPREADSYLQKQKQRQRFDAGIDENDFKRWAYAECESLWRKDVTCVREVSEGFASGVSTVADVVAIIEQW